MNAPSASRPVRIAALIVAAAACLAYANSFWGVFLFDDGDGILKNPTIRHLWPLATVLTPPSDSGTTVNGRPLVNFTLALNYAASGTDPWSYHLVNLAIHLLAGLTLLGIVRRTLSGPAFRASPLSAQALPVALAAALLWTLHPLQTEAVTYVIQRAESLTGLLYLLTLYTFIRAVEVEVVNLKHHRLWLAASATACLLGMATKEVMATAPLLVFLYDRTFVAGTFRVAGQRRRRYYLALSATWLLLAWLELGTHGRGNTAGFGLGIPWWVYGLRQFQSILSYLRLALWPSPLTFDNGYYDGPAAIAAHLWEVTPAVLVIGVLLAATLWAVRHRPALGFLGCWFFLILAPSSSIVPVFDVRMEHRVYLSLAALAVGAVCGLYTWLGRRAWIIVGILATAYALLTALRNYDYRSTIAFWSAEAAHQPDNSKVRVNLGDAYFADNQLDLALPQFQQAIRLSPGQSLAYNGLGGVLSRLGEGDRAILAFNQALQLKPDYADARYNLGNALILQGKWNEAVTQLQLVLKEKPDYVQARDSLGIALAETGHLPEAAAQFQEAIRLNPTSANAHYNLGKTYAAQGRNPEAAAELRESLRLQPDNPQVQAALGKLTGP